MTKAKDTVERMIPPRKAKDPKVLVPARVINKEGAKGIILVKPKKKRRISGGMGGTRKTITD